MASELHYSARVYFEDYCNIMLAVITTPFVMYEIIDNHAHGIQMGMGQNLILVNNGANVPKVLNSEKFLFAKK
jgi:hypothetical protein